MGQGPSHTDDYTGTRVENPPDASPRGLALIAHGRWGNMNDPLVRRLAEYFRDERGLRVVTWNDLQAGGRWIWEDFATWTGEVGDRDYNRILGDSMAKFVGDFPNVQGAELFICGYSAGAISAGCARPPPYYAAHFSPVRYALISYPVESNFFITIARSGSCFRSVEALVQGCGWEGLRDEFGCKEPDVAGVLTVTGGSDIGPFYGVWTGILGEKNRRGNLKQVSVSGVGHTWEGPARDYLVEEFRKWLA